MDNDREILEELKSVDQHRIAEYLRQFGFKTLLAAVIPAVMVLGVNHIGIGFMSNFTQLRGFSTVTYLLGIPLGHFFYKLFHKSANGLGGRLCQILIYQVVLLLMVTLEIKLLNPDITIYFNFGAIVSLLLIIPVVELAWTVVNGILKAFRINLW